MNEKKFSAKRYDSQSSQFSLIFDLLRHSLKELRDPGFRRLMENMRLREEPGVSKILAFLETHPEIATGLPPASDLTRHHRKKMSSIFPVTRTLKWAEYKGHALLALNSSELIIRVALFEAFLKDIHRQTLVAKPKLLSLCKPNRPIPLKSIFQGGFERFKLDEIDRQVRETDRLKTNGKATFFRRSLKLPWDENLDRERELVKRIEELINLRHKLVHSDPNTSVTDRDIKDTRELLNRVSANCVRAAANIYAAYFTYP